MLDNASTEQLKAELLRREAADHNKAVDLLERRSAWLVEHAGLLLTEPGLVHTCGLLTDDQLRYSTFNSKHCDCPRCMLLYVQWMGYGSTVYISFDLNEASHHIVKPEDGELEIRWRHE